jgi:hypothetical protein
MIFESSLDAPESNVAARHFDGRWFLSRRDSTIVARHEVPGIQALRAWNHEENYSVPAGRLNRSRLRFDAGYKVPNRPRRRLGIGRIARMDNGHREGIKRRGISLAPQGNGRRRRMRTIGGTEHPACGLLRYVSLPTTVPIARAIQLSGMSSVATTNICGTDHDFDRPSGTGPLCFDGTQALRAWLRSACPSGTKSHSPVEAAYNYLSAQLS